MGKFIEQYFAVAFPLFFASLWLIVTTILGVFSGWFRLMAKFPNQNDEPLLRLRTLSGTMGMGVSMQNVLRLSVCPSGLRVGMMRLLGPFCRDFLVPWKDITIFRKTRLFWPVAKLQFGNPRVGTLTISSHIANRLAGAAKEVWPERGPFPEEKLHETARRLFIRWALATFLAALFFTLTPRMVSPHGPQAPILVTILFPAVFLGVAAAVQFFRDRH